MSLAAAILQRCCLDQRDCKKPFNSKAITVLSKQRFKQRVEWALEWTSGSSVSWNCLFASITERCLSYTTVSALTPLSPINNHCLHWTLQHGHKMVFLSSLLDASLLHSESTLCPLLISFNPFPAVYFAKHLWNTPIFFQADSTPQQMHIPSPTPQPLVLLNAPPSHTLLVFAVKTSHI